MSGAVTAVEIGGAVAEGVGAAAEIDGAMALVDAGTISTAEAAAYGETTSQVANAAAQAGTQGTISAAEAAAYGETTSQVANAAANAGTQGTISAAEAAAYGETTSQVANAAAQAAKASGLPSWVSPAVQAASKLATGMEQANAARTASSQLAAADAKAGQENLAIYDKQQALQAPWVQAGQEALTQLEQGTAEGGRFNRPFSLADMQDSAVNPTYQFTKDEALAAMKNQAAAGGQNLSSNTIQGAGTLAGNLAAQYENQAFNQYQASNQSALLPLQSLAKVGQSATNSTQVAGQNYNTAQIPLTTGAGAATAAGTVVGSNALTQGLGGAINTVASSPQIMNSLASIFNTP